MLGHITIITSTTIQCIYADVGTNGRISDGGVLNKCSLSRGLEDGSVSLPPPKCLPFGVAQLPHVFVSDDAFALKKNMMKPYAQNGIIVEKRESTTIDTAEPGEYLRISSGYLQTGGEYLELFCS